jgi:predicted lipoprotein with Yx(FWY)xxD motif
MKALQRSGPFAIIVLLTILLTACSGMTDQGSTATTTNQGMNTGTSTATTTGNMNKGTPVTRTTPTTNGGMNNGNTMQGITITLNTTGDTSAFIRTGNATINGKQMSVLTTTKGFAVYYYKPDATLTSTCTGQCAKEWPPLVAGLGVTVSSSVLLPKQLAVQHTANGDQIFYDGHALYTYAQDKQAGQALGYGQDMEWYLADSTMSNTLPVNNGGMSNGTPVATKTPTTNGNTMPGITITPATTGNMAAFIHTGKVTITGIQVNILTTNNDFAIYYYMNDTAFTSTCTGQCAKDWPPVLAPQGMTTVSSSVTLPRQLSVHQTANGAQVFYDGHALYTYAQDMQAGHATGRGEDEKWYLVGLQL